MIHLGTSTKNEKKSNKTGRTHKSPDSLPPRGTITWNLSWNPQLNMLCSLTREYCIKRHDLALYEPTFSLNVFPKLIFLSFYFLIFKKLVFWVTDLNSPTGIYSKNQLLLYWFSIHAFFDNGYLLPIVWHIILPEWLLITLLLSLPPMPLPQTGLLYLSPVPLQCPSNRPSYYYQYIVCPKFPKCKSVYVSLLLETLY